MHRLGLAVVVCLLAGGMVYVTFHWGASTTGMARPNAGKTGLAILSPNPPGEQPTSGNLASTGPAANAPSQIERASPQDGNGAPTAKPALVSSEPGFTNLPPETVVEHLRTTLRAYQSMFGGNPVGTNPEITAALNGGNPKQAQFIREDYGLRINARGELIDPWGTPYFFHQLSGTEMEIHSAGPDKVLWTGDDIVLK